MPSDPSSDKPVPRILQQQPARESDPEQQRAGATDFQQHGQAAQDGIEGEGSYSASRDYQKNIRQYMDKADVAGDAARARPRSAQAAKDLDAAEREARAHSKGER